MNKKRETFKRTVQPDGRGHKSGINRKVSLKGITGEA